MQFSNSSPDNLYLNGDRAVCLETIRDVAVKGKEPDEKVIVKIERRMGVAQETETESGVRSRLFQTNEEDFGDSSIIEDRNIVFMRGKTAEQIAFDKERFGQDERVIRSACPSFPSVSRLSSEFGSPVEAPGDPEFRFPIIPSKAALFRFSALTFNAHSIHLNQYYTHDVEGYRNLLVHGPLTLALMLTVLQSRLPGRVAIKDIQYRNVAPVYVDEEMSACGRQLGGDGAWDVWIEGKNGGLAVRGTVYTGG